MVGRETSSGEFKRKLSDVQRVEVDHHLSQGRGVAAYEDSYGRPILVMTWGSRDADLPGYPPAHYGGGTLSTWVPAPKEATPLRSPLMGWEQPRQIARPRVSPAFTEVPEVRLEMRTSQHPRGNSEYITPLLPGRSAEPEQPVQQEVSKEASWWAKHLS
jgi:hypothetical protein